MTEQESITIAAFSALPKAAKEIRIAVFQAEQGFADEFDALDTEAQHLVLYVDGEAVGTCRYYPNADGKSCSIGRVAVLQAYRGKDLGRRLILAAEQGIAKAGYRKSVVSAQVRVQGFYERLGYAAQGEIYLDEFCPHIHMEKDL